MSRHKGVSSDKKTWPDLFHYVIVWKSPSGCPHSTPSPTRSSHLTAILNEPWEFLTTIWLAPSQRTPWPAWKQTSIHIWASTQRTPRAFITRMYERETRNDKSSQVDWFCAICMICSGVVDIETLRDCFWCCVCAKMLQNTYFTGLWTQNLCRNFHSCCEQLKSIHCVFCLVSTTTHCLIQLQHTPKEQFGFTNQNLNLPSQLFVSIQHSKLSWRRQLVMTPSFIS